MAPANFVIYLKQNRHFLRLLHMFSILLWKADHV
jgi:hypothetical protein